MLRPWSFQALRGQAAVRGRVVALVFAATLPLLVGQRDRELLPPDDLREAEVAREMWEGGDYVIPRLAGLPFVEKPSGFQAVVASAYAATGGPSANAARGVSAAFALATLFAVFLLGERTIGREGAAVAVALLALSSRFCRTAHDVLLDDALTAALAFALLFGWIALATDEPRAKRRAYAAASFALGISFLFKGLVGPALFGAGLATHLVATRRFGELRHAVRPLAVVAFLMPVLLWCVPFVERGSPALLREFFIDNHWRRATAGYASNVRPFTFYALDLWSAFAPASLLLPFAVVSAVRTRRAPEGRAPIYFASVAAGMLALLSLSKAKDSVYALPAFPALALLVAGACERALRAGGRPARLAAAAAGAVAAASLAAALVATVVLGGVSWSIAGTSAAAAGLGVLGIRSLRSEDLRAACTASAWGVALAWSLWFTGPIAAREIDRRSLRGPVEAALRLAGDRTILLYGPGDGLRGAASFYRNRTAQEVTDPSLLVRRLAENDGARAMFLERVDEPLPSAIVAAASRLGAELVVDVRVPSGREHAIVLVRARSSGTESASPGEAAPGDDGRAPGSG